MSEGAWLWVGLGVLAAITILSVYLGRNDDGNG